MLAKVTEFWPMKVGRSDIYHFSAWPLKTSLAALYTCFTLRELSPTKMIPEAIISISKNDT